MDDVYYVIGVTPKLGLEIPFSNYQTVSLMRLPRGKAEEKAKLFKAMEDIVKDLAKEIAKEMPVSKSEGFEQWKSKYESEIKKELEKRVGNLQRKFLNIEGHAEEYNLKGSYRRGQIIESGVILDLILGYISKDWDHYKDDQLPKNLHHKNYGSYIRL